MYKGGFRHLLEDLDSLFLICLASRVRSTEKHDTYRGAIDLPSIVARIMSRQYESLCESIGDGGLPR